MPIPLDAPEVLNREFLPIRAKILEIAAALDRLERAEGSAAGDHRLSQIERSLAALQDTGPDRAERVQMIFSLPFDDDWQARFQRDGWQAAEGRGVSRPK
jgi:hypothetical protein